MKNLALILLLLVTQNCFSQDGLLPLDANKQVVYTDSGKPEKSKSELFKQAQEWIGKTFGNYENAVTFEDPQVGKLVLTSYAPVSSTNYQYVRFDLTIECTDGQYNVLITQLDGISTIHSPERLGAKDNAVIMEKEVAVQTEQNRKKRTDAETALKNAKADLEAINNAMFGLMSGLKVALTTPGGQ